MATRSAADAVAPFSNKIRLDDRFALRVLKETFSASKSSGNPMITTEFEIVAPETTSVNGESVNVAGVKITHYTTVKVKAEDGSWDKEASDKAFSRLVGYYKALGVEVPTEIDDENPPMLGEGKIVDALVLSDETVARKQATPEQRAARQQGDKILDGDGREIIAYYPKIKSILGPSSVAIGRPF